MNNTVKESIKTIDSAVSYCFSAFAQSFVSLLRILVLSSLKAAIQSKSYKELKLSTICYVLGNGPSLKDVLDKGEIIAGEGDILCVNMFCLSNYFEILKPRFYLLCDGQYFNPTNERTKRQVKELVNSFNSVDWELFLIIPPMADRRCELLTSIENSNVNILYNNSVEVSGFKWFRHFVYRHGFGMPRCQTVINYALTTAINMRYKTINLFGAEHSWSKDMWVGDDNRVYTGDPHLYENKEKAIALSSDISEEFMNLSKAFATHKTIRVYADSEGVAIFNRTKGSFIDAYERIN